MSIPSVGFTNSILPSWETPSKYEFMQVTHGKFTIGNKIYELEVREGDGRQIEDLVNKINEIYRLNQKNDITALRKCFRGVESSTRIIEVKLIDILIPSQAVGAKKLSNIVSLEEGLGFDLVGWKWENKDLVFSKVLDFVKRYLADGGDVWNLEVRWSTTLLQFLKEDPEFCHRLILEKVLPMEQIGDKDRKEIVMNDFRWITSNQFIGSMENDDLRIQRKEFLKRLPSYEFKEKSDYLEIIKMAASSLPKETTEYLNEFYRLFDVHKKNKLEIAQACLKEAAAIYYLNLPLEDLHSKFEISTDDVRDLLESKILRDIDAHLSDFPSRKRIEIMNYFFKQQPQDGALFKELWKQSKDNPGLKEKLKYWVFQKQVTYFCARKKIDAKNELEALKVAYEQLIKHHSPQDREDIGTLFIEFSRPWFLKKWYKTIKTNTKTPPVHTLMPVALALCSTDNKKTLARFTKELRKERDTFKNAKNMHLLVSFLLGLQKLTLTLDQRKFLISQIFREKGKALEPRLRSLNLFLNLGKVEMIARTRPIANEVLAKMAQELVYEVFNFNKDEFGDPEVFNKLYIERIENRFRDPDALFVYLGKINTLPSPEKEAMKAAYSKFVISLLKNEFYQLRNQSPQLVELQKQEDGQRVTKTWNDPPRFESLDKYLSDKKSEDTFSTRFKSFLSEKLIADKHIDNLQNRLPYLYDFLKGEKVINAESLLGQISISLEEPSLETELQQCCLKLYLCKEKDDALLTQLQNTLKALHDKDKKTWDEFSNDIKGFLKQLKSVQKGAMTIGITKDSSDLLLLARETGGCQSIDGTPDLNKCALAYVIDGKNSAIVIKDVDGKMKARAVLRLLMDETTNKPVLFLERHYLGIGDPNLNIAINNYAINYAKTLSLPLLTKEALIDTVGIKQFGPIISVGSNAPFEYSDAGGGTTNGKFRIENSYVMFDPAILTSE